MLSFGREAVDARGPVGDFPAASTLTGLLANALGWRREERDRHSRLQARLVFAARLDRPGTRITDFQTAQLAQADRGWTTRGVPEGRAGGANTYAAPHIRLRDYDADKRVTVALHLEPAEDAPTVDDLAAALDAPARPLFLGRKACLPSAQLLIGVIEADGLLQALSTVPTLESGGAPLRVLLPLSEPMERTDERRWVTDTRDWLSGVHSGGREVLVRTLPSKPQGGS
jgi:CRISPR system Cascade subunit CasD